MPATLAPVAAWAVQLDPDGKRQLDEDGKVILSETDDEDCCCGGGCFYRYFAEYVCDVVDTSGFFEWVITYGGKVCGLPEGKSTSWVNTGNCEWEIYVEGPDPCAEDVDCPLPSEGLIPDPPYGGSPPLPPDGECVQEGCERVLPLTATVTLNDIVLCNVCFNDGIGSGKALSATLDGATYTLCREGCGPFFTAVVDGPGFEFYEFDPACGGAPTFVTSKLCITFEAGNPNWNLEVAITIDGDSTISCPADNCSINVPVYFQGSAAYPVPCVGEILTLNNSLTACDFFAAGGHGGTADVSLDY